MPWRHAYGVLAMDKVSAFPHLTAEEFIKACADIQPLLSDSALVVDDSACLRITRRLDSALALNADGQEHVDSQVETPEDHDEEAIVKHSQNGSFVTVHYDILLSPSYRVPVVYMTASPPLPVSHFFDLVVPHHFQDAMRETGVMGALSMTVIVDPVEMVSSANLALAGSSFDGHAGILCTPLPNRRHHVRCEVRRHSCPRLYASLAGDCWSKRGLECVEHRFAPCCLRSFILHRFLPWPHRPYP